MTAEISGVAEAAEVVAQLVAADGCAWHREQTHASLIRYLLEEAYEVADAVDHELGPQALAEELGDVLYQVLLHSALASQAEAGFDINAVGERLAAKLRARHPHVFGDLGPKTAAELTQMWEQLKASAAAGEGVAAGETAAPRSAAVGESAAAAPQPVLFRGIPAALPSLMKAQKVVERQHRAGLEPRAALQNLEIDSAAAAYGAEIYELVTRAAAEGVDVDQALRATLAQVIVATADG